MTDNLAQEREAYLKKTMEENPDYREILPLFIAICEYVRENTTGVGVSFSVPVDARERIAAGAPAINATDLVVDGSVAIAFLQGLAERMSSLGIGETKQFRSFQYISAQEIGKLLQAWFEGRRGVLQSASMRLRINPGVLETLLAVPVKEAAVAAASGVPAEWYAGWTGRTCPVCGSEPSMAELKGPEGNRFLSCGVCRSEWEFSKPACPLCGNEKDDEVSYFMVEGDHIRIDVCGRCSRYLKTRDNRVGGDDVPLDLLDVTTMHLDIIAERQGFSRG